MMLIILDEVSNTRLKLHLVYCVLLQVKLRYVVGEITAAIL